MSRFEEEPTYGPKVQTTHELAQWLLSQPDMPIRARGHAEDFDSYYEIQPEVKTVVTDSYQLERFQRWDACKGLGIEFEDREGYARHEARAKRYYAKLAKSKTVII